MHHVHPGATSVHQEAEREYVRVRIDLAYDGSPFKGWARQPNAETVQGSIEDALAILIRRDVRTVVAGRTDAGVHARGQVVHCDLSQQEWARLRGGGAEDVATTLQRRLSGVLARVLGVERRQRGLTEIPGAIVIRNIQKAVDGFDARFSAIARQYIYRIDDGAGGHDPLTRHSMWWVKDSLDVAAMDTAVQPVMGLHDFLSFCKPRSGATTVRQVRTISVERTAQGVVELHIEADAFCHNMVRSIVGAAVKVGRGERPTHWVVERLVQQQRSSDMLLAPPQGLVLERVLYPEDADLADRAAQTRARRQAPTV